jgi:hypothetical protein
MVDFDELAFEAIESVAVEDFHEFDNGNWINAVPTGNRPEGIGFDADTWPSEAKKIANKFNVLLGLNGPVSPMDTDYAASGSKPLRDYQRFLADLASRLAFSRSITQFRSGEAQ